MSEIGPVSITDAQFEEEVLKANGIVFVDFWAPWCGPCVQMSPAVKEFAGENEGRVKVFKLDVDENPKTAERYGIKTVPTLIFFEGGNPVDTSTGAASKATLQSKLDTLLSRSSLQSNRGP
jgi:thioredoxin 1